MPRWLIVEYVLLEERGSGHEMIGERYAMHEIGKYGGLIKLMVLQ